jgi:hypothetical protein
MNYWLRQKILLLCCFVLLAGTARLERFDAR